MKDYEIIVGLEVHAELSTKTKIYCGCKNSFGSVVNSNCCPVCTGMPGALPTLNKSVVEYAVKAGHALNCPINRISKQDRKNYFYPDLPKAYQISQFDIPVCGKGYVDVILDEEGNTKRIGVTRIHIEEDAGKLIHLDGSNASLVDFNRCGVPLIEIVSEPDIRGAEEAKAYLDTIKAILSNIGVSDCKMQEGSLRCDVNVSVHKKGEPFGTRVEMKNVSTFSGACRAIEYEAERQIEVLENGGEIQQETRRWDDANGVNVILRTKENANDYRYFPEPDLLTIVIPEVRVEELKNELPELPNKKLLRLMKEYSIPHFDANLLVDNIDKGEFFEKCCKSSKCEAKNISNWLLGDVSRILNEKKLTLADSKLTEAKLCEMVKLIESNTISNAAGKVVIEEIMWSDKTAQNVVDEKGLAQISDDSALEQIVRDVLTANPKPVEDYKNGKTNVAGFLVGQCMKATKGKGNPAKLREIVLAQIEQA